MDDFIHYVTQMHADEFGTFERGVKVEVRDVHGHELHARH